MNDPFADGVPAGDYHTWVKPVSEPCPNCVCCSKALCDLVRQKDAVGDPFAACHMMGGASDFDLGACPCWRTLPGHLSVASDEPDYTRKNATTP